MDAVDHHPRPVALDRRPISVLILSNLLGGVGVAAGIAVGALLVESVGGTSIAGLGQAAGVLGAAISAVPLARLAGSRGRRWSLAVGYALAVTGAVIVLVGAVLAQTLVLLAGLGLFGVAQAANLQSRYAAADGVPAASRGRVMSLVLWATTIGSVLGPNLSAVGARAGEGVGVPALAGPYLFSLMSFAAAGLVIALLYRPPFHAARAEGAAPGRSAIAPTGAMAALRWAASHPPARFAVVLIASGHAVMVMVMVMTPIHLHHHGLTVVGLVISLHTLGMYAFSPIFGWLADRWGTVATARLAVGILALSLVLGLAAAVFGGSAGLTAVALGVLGLGWSASTISGSALLTDAAAADVLVPLQGAADAGMNYAGALAAAVAGPVLAFGGFEAVNVVAAVVLVPAALLGFRLHHALHDG